MRHDSAAPESDHGEIPNKGDRIELVEAQAGVRLQGTVFHVDQVQLLVKWDNGRSGSLTPGADCYRIVRRAGR
jgi:hypothetical protein